MTAATEDLEHALRTLLTALKPDPELSEQHNEMYLRIVAIPRAEAALAKYQGESAMAKYQEAVERHRMQVEQSTHPVDALKQCGLEMTAEQEAQMREHCDAPIQIAMTIEKAREVAEGHVRNLLSFSYGDEALIRNFTADQLEAIAVLMRAGEI